MSTRLFAGRNTRALSSTRLGSETGRRADWNRLNASFESSWNSIVYVRARVESVIATLRTSFDDLVGVRGLWA